MNGKPARIDLDRKLYERLKQMAWKDGEKSPTQYIHEMVRECIDAAEGRA